MVKCLPEFEYFTVFLKNKNIIFKIRRSKVTDYAALTLRRHCNSGPRYAWSVSCHLTNRLSDHLHYWQGFWFFSRLVGWSDPWSKKWGLIFWNDGFKHIKLTTVDIWVVPYFTCTLTQTLVWICTLTADDTVKPFLSGHWKKKQLSLNAGQKYCRMLQGEHSAILLTFIKLSFLLRSLFFVFFERLLKTCFTVLTIYMYFLFCCCKMNIFIKVRFFRNKIKMGPLGPLPWKVMGHILKSWDNNSGPP